MNRRAAAVLGLIALLAPAADAREATADLAIVLAIDVSQSIDAEHYALQMEGIAAAFVSPEVQHSLFSGQHRTVLVAVVQWSTRPALALPWTVLTKEADADRLAQRIRTMAREGNGFTCMSRALRTIADKLILQAPMHAERRVVDVSGDGRDNCNPADPVARVRDDLVADGVTINGLPILEGDEADTLEAWYRANVAGGPNSFVLPAEGFDDFERAFRRKFIVEVSAGPAATSQQARR